MARKDLYLDRLQRVPMFRGLNQKQLRTLAQQADEVRVDAGHVLIREGEKGQEFFFLVSGKVAVTVGGKEVAVLGGGDFFGELAMLDPAPRAATVTTLEPSELLVIGARRFQPLLDDVPQLARKIMAGLAHRLREADRQRIWQ